MYDLISSEADAVYERLKNGLGIAENESNGYNDLPKKRGRRKNFNHHLNLV